MIVDDEQFEAMLVAWAESLTEAEKSEAREALARRCTDRKTKVKQKLDRRCKPCEGTSKPMKNDLDTLALNDFDRDFLRDLGIEIPVDARWEIDADPIGPSEPEAAE